MKRLQRENPNNYITHIEADDHVIVNEPYLELSDFRNGQGNYEAIDFM